MSKAKVIHKDGLFVRKDKSRSSEWVRIIPCGEEFEFYEEYKGWLKVVDGWVVCSDVYIKPTEVTAGGSGGAGVSSWNDLTDKPFGEETTTIEWDGNTEGLVNVPTTPYFKVSDLAPAYEEIIGGTVVVVVNPNGEFETPLTSENVIVFSEHIYGNEAFMVATAPTEFDGVVVDEPGIYFAKADDIDVHLKSLTWSKVKTIDTKFIQEEYHGTVAKTVVVNWNGQIDGRDTFKRNAMDYYKVSDEVIPFSDAIVDGSSKFSNSEIFDEGVTKGVNCYAVGSTAAIVVTKEGPCSVQTSDDNVNTSFTAPSTGVYFMKQPSRYVDVAAIFVEDTVTTSKSMPNTVVTIVVDDNYNVESVSMSTEKIAELIKAGCVVIAHIPMFGVFAPFNVCSQTSSNRPFVICRTLIDDTRSMYVGGYYSGSKSADVWEYRETELAIVEK